MPFSDIPYEVLEVIVAATLRDASTINYAELQELRLLSLVNQSFRQICQGHLFSHLELGMYGDRLILGQMDYVSEDPVSRQFLCSAKALALCCYGSMPSPKVYRQYCDVLDTIRNLETIGIFWASEVASHNSVVNLREAHAGRHFKTVCLVPHECEKHTRSRASGRSGRQLDGLSSYKCTEYAGGGLGIDL